jgi:galactokinase
MQEIKSTIDKDKLRDSFIRLYGTKPRLFRAPGRVNLIGEHTDYNDGFVLPIAIDRETIVAAAPRIDRLLKVRSTSMSAPVEIDLDRPGSPRRGEWFAYVEGVARALMARGKALVGADLLIESNVPLGAGLSSSAALEISSGLALLGVSEQELDHLTLTLVGRDAEHTYVGTMCGIMDQYVATFGKSNNALLIDCRTLESTEIPVVLSNIEIVVCDTHVKHNLASSEYNIRRAQCEEGVRLLKQVIPNIKALRDVSKSQLDHYQDRLPEVIKRRCRHVITENARTLNAADALTVGDLKGMGTLMSESHRSLRDDYEVSCRELDLMVELAQSASIVFGARMTGGGFGGCTVNLVLRDGFDEFREKVLDGYECQTGLSPSAYIVTPSDGANEIE